MLSAFDIVLNVGAVVFGSVMNSSLKTNGCRTCCLFTLCCCLFNFCFCSCFGVPSPTPEAYILLPRFLSDVKLFFLFCASLFHC